MYSTTLTFPVLHNGHVFIAASGETPDYFASTVILDAVTGKVTYVGDETDAAVVEAMAAPGAVLQTSRAAALLMGICTYAGPAHRYRSRTCARSGTRSAPTQLSTEHPRILCQGWFHPSTDANELVTQLDGLDVDGKDCPVYVDDDDMHSSWLNTAALDELGLADMADPPGGRVRRGTDGKPSGVMEETAASNFHVWAALDAYVTVGYQGVVDMAMGEEDCAALQKYRQRHGGLPIWVAAHWLIFPGTSPEGTLQQVDRATQYNKAASQRFHIAGIKIIWSMPAPPRCSSHTRTITRPLRRFGRQRHSRRCRSAGPRGAALPRTRSGWEADQVLVDMAWDAEMLLHAKVAETWIKENKVYTVA
ncbi:hypothetical protein MY1884_009612 [Beauveria asiatica]